MVIDELIAALEKAEGPSRELDQAVGICAKNIGRDPALPQVIGVANCAEYTASIDAALTLVPDEFDWYVSSEFHGTKWFATVTSKDRLHHFVARGVLSSPAIALCIAALNARKP